jgi:hypothetical protein
MWMRVTSAWLCAALYAWSLVAPVLRELLRVSACGERSADTILAAQCRIASASTSRTLLLPPLYIYLRLCLPAIGRLSSACADERRSNACGKPLSASLNGHLLFERAADASAQRLITEVTAALYYQAAPSL